MPPTKKVATNTEITTITHDEASRKNIPTAELQGVMDKAAQKPIRISYDKRNADLDPQLIWRGKYDGDEELHVMAPPLYIQEKVHPKILIEDLRRKAAQKNPVKEESIAEQVSLFADFNGIPESADKTDFYQHE